MAKSKAVVWIIEANGKFGWGPVYKHTYNDFLYPKGQGEEYANREMEKLKIENPSFELRVSRYVRVEKRKT